MIQEVTPSPSVVSSSQPSTSKKAKASSSAAAAAPTYADIEAELALRSRNLSSTLHKLHLWEKKLYEEVKVCSFLTELVHTSLLIFVVV